MSTTALDPLVHNPDRLRVIATLAALPDGDTLSGSRLCGRLTTRRDSGHDWDCGFA